jgi:uncharacterized protein HemX
MADTLPTKTENDLNWLRHHLILLGLVVVLVVGSIYAIESLIASHDHEAYVREQTLFQQMNQQNQQLQAQTKEQIEALTQQNVALQQEVSSLAGAIANRDRKLEETQAKVPNLNPDQLSAEWKTQIKNAGDVKPILPSGYQVDQLAAVATVQALQSVPVLEQDKHDLEQSNTNLVQELNNETQKFDLEAKAHVSDNATCKESTNVLQKQISDIKAQNRKRNLLIGVFSFIAGMAAHAAGF